MFPKKIRCFFALLVLIAATHYSCQSSGEKQPDRTAAADSTTADTLAQKSPEVNPSLAPVDSGSPEAAVAVLKSYYDAINARKYEKAYQCWGDSGRASKQTYRQFRDGFAETDSVRADIGEPGRMEAAAGSRYIEIPLSLSAWSKKGKLTHYEGKYVLRRAVVDGATVVQRHWHLYNAEIHQQ